MQIKNINKKRLIAIIFIIGIIVSSFAKAQTNFFKDSLGTPKFIVVRKDTAKFFVVDRDTIFVKAKHFATFPGELRGWKRFLETHLQYPEKAQEKGTQGVVKVGLLVDKEGKVIEVKALNNPGDGLAEEAERVLKNCPNWIPATQNGRKIKYAFAQTVTFQLQ